MSLTKNVLTKYVHCTTALGVSLRIIFEFIRYPNNFRRIPWGILGRILERYPLGTPSWNVEEGILRKKSEKIPEGLLNVIPHKMPERKFLEEFWMEPRMNTCNNLRLFHMEFRRKFQKGSGTQPQVFFLWNIIPVIFSEVIPEMPKKMSEGISHGNSEKNPESIL